MSDLVLDFRCPGCNTLSSLIVGPTQAFCTTPTTACRVFAFDPSLPDGGLSQAAVINLDLNSPPPPRERQDE